VRGLGGLAAGEVGLLLGLDLGVGAGGGPGIDEGDGLAAIRHISRIDEEAEDDGAGGADCERGGDPLAARAVAPESGEIPDERARAGGAEKETHAAKIAPPRRPRHPRLPIGGAASMLQGMIRPFLVALLALAAAPAAGETRRLAVGDFDRVIVEGPYEVHLVTGRASAASATGRRESLDRLSVDVQGMTLRIRRSRNAWAGTPGADPGIVAVELSTRALRSARLIGPARFAVEGVRGLRVEFSVEGSGTLTARGVDADHLALALLGSGRLDIAGATRNLAGNFQGTGDVDAAALAASAATISNTSGGAVTLTVNGPATIANQGLGTIRVGGRPVCTISGVGGERVLCARSDQRQHR
jgi:hypothetical protein